MRFSIEAEQSLVGGLLLDPNRLDDVLEITGAEDFYSADNRSIMRYITEVAQAGRTADVITVADAMSGAGMLDAAGGIGYLVELANNTPGASNVAAYAHIVAERAIERRISEAGQRIAELGEDESIGVDDKLDTLHSELAGLERRDNAGIIPYDKILKSRIQAIDGKFHNTTPRGMYTGFSALDERFMGIGNTDLWVVAARPSMGKTALAMNVAYNQAAQGKEVIIFSMEMSKDQLTDRLISSVSGINSNLIRSGKLTEHDWPALGAGISKLKEMKIHIIDIAGIDIHRAKAIARKFARFGKIGLIVVDYLQLMTDSKAKSRFEEVSSVSRELKVMAKMIGCPVLALSQLNRGVESRTIKKPGLADLRESGQIEQDADLITFIYRDEYYHPDTPNKGTAELITAKFREGEVGTDILGTELQYARFKDIDFSNYQFDYKPTDGNKPRGGGFS
jgi:replicative DNA helicase